MFPYVSYVSIALNMNAIEQGFEEYAKVHPEQKELVGECRNELEKHRQEILLILANLNDKIITKTGDAPARPITQSMSTTSRKGILVASIGDLTGLLSGTYENIYYYINDHLGTPQMLTDQNAVVVWQADYDPFGKATVNDDPDGNGTHVTNNIRFPGQYFDSETALHYNYHRYYDPGIGRYLSPDPVPGKTDRPQSYNLYPYVENNPVNRKDPSGLAWYRYGNWCGPGGSGTPTNCADSACKRHDECYDKCGIDAFSRWLPSNITSGCAAQCDETLANDWKKCACSHGASGSW